MNKSRAGVPITCKDTLSFLLASSQTTRPSRGTMSFPNRHLLVAVPVVLAHVPHFRFFQRETLDAPFGWLSQVGNTV